MSAKNENTEQNIQDDLADDSDETKTETVITQKTEVVKEKPNTTETPASETVTPEKPETKVFNIADLTRDYPELQDYLNSKIGEARKDGREKGKADLLKTIGVDDPAVVKDLLQAEQARKEAEMSALEKLETKIAQLQKEKEKAEQARQDFETKTRKALIHSEVQSMARDLSFNDADDLARLLDYEKVEVDLETNAVEGIKEQAKLIAKQKPYLIKQVSQKPNVPATPQPANTETQEKVKQDQAKSSRTWKPKSL
jgi:hypothetical protein